MFYDLTHLGFVNQPDVVSGTRHQAPGQAPEPARDARSVRRR